MLAGYDELLAAVERQRLYGVFSAQVTEVVDPDQQGRVKIRLPWSPDPDSGSYQVWARLAVLMAGNNRGTWFIPDVDDEVVVAFEGGDPRRPIVVGALWNGQDAPPETMDQAGENLKKTIRTRNGVTIVMDDTQGQESVSLETPGGQKITLSDGPGVIELVDSNGNSARFESSGVTITAAAKVTVNAATVEVSAGMVKVDAAMSRFSGVVQADTVISNSVVSASYTPGAGNVW